MRIHRKYVKASVNQSNNINYDKLYEIADRYTTSTPLSGEWSTEVLHEQKAISKELGVSMNKAKQLMIDELGFTEDMFGDNNFDLRYDKQFGEPATEVFQTDDFMNYMDEVIRFE